MKCRRWNSSKLCSSVSIFIRLSPELKSFDLWYLFAMFTDGMMCCVHGLWSCVEVLHGLQDENPIHRCVVKGVSFILGFLRMPPHTQLVTVDQPNNRWNLFYEEVYWTFEENSPIKSSNKEHCRVMVHSWEQTFSDVIIFIFMWFTGGTLWFGVFVQKRLRMCENRVSSRSEVRATSV